MEQQRFYLEFENIDELFNKCAIVMDFMVKNKWAAYSADFRNEKLIKKLAEMLQAVDRDA